MNAPETAWYERLLFGAAFAKLLARAQGLPAPWTIDLVDGGVLCAVMNFSAGQPGAAMTNLSELSAGAVTNLRRSRRRARSCARAAGNRAPAQPSAKRAPVAAFRR